MSRDGAIAIIGAGTIGVGWAIAFSRGRHPVRIYDPDSGRLTVSESEINERIERLDSLGLIEETPAELSGRIAFVPTLSGVASGAAYFQECSPEKLDLKRELFRALVEIADGNAVLASSTSAIAPSELFRGLPAADRCLVAHPTNPPYLLPVVELVRSVSTSDDTVNFTADLMEEIGMSPIRVRKENEGFVVNRLQGAVLREAYCLMRDGIASVDEIDQAVRDGLGRRWAITGPFETADLNTRGGIASHARKMGPAYERMGADRGQHDPWTDEMVGQAEAERRALLPLEDWNRRVDWRDGQLMAHEVVRKEPS